MWGGRGLTASRFVACPFGGRERGCIAAGIWRAGVLMGSCGIWAVPMSRSRSAGIRIELGEIQSALADLDGVEQAAVIAREDRPGDKRLVGYVTGRADPAEVRAQLVGAVAGLYGAGGGGGAGCVAVDGQRQARPPGAAGPGVRREWIVTGPRARRPRRSWPASMPRCWGWSGSGSMTRSSIWVGIRCRRCG